MTTRVPAADELREVSLAWARSVRAVSEILESRARRQHEEAVATGIRRLARRSRERAS